MEIISVATEWKSTFENFKRSLNKFKYNLKVLGFKETWLNWKWRTQKYLNYLNTLDESNIVILLDAYDVIAVRNQKELLNTFLAFETKIVVGSEWYCGSAKNCKPLNKYWGFKKPYRQYANAGCLMGYVKNLKQVLNYIIDFQDDQYGLIEYIENNPDEIKLDFGSSIFYNCHIADGYFNTNAFFIHFPGPLLKYGLHNTYNYYCTKVLKNNASLQHCSMYIDSILHFFILLMLIVVFS